MSSVKIIISGVTIESRTRLERLVFKLQNLNNTALPVKFDQSVLLRLALDDLLKSYENDPSSLYSRLENNTDRGQT